MLSPSIKFFNEKVDEKMTTSIFLKKMNEFKAFRTKRNVKTEQKKWRCRFLPLAEKNM